MSKQRLIRKADTVENYQKQYEAPGFDERVEKAFAKLNNMDNDKLADLITDQVFENGDGAPRDMVNNVMKTLDWEAACHDYFLKFGYKILSMEDEDDIQLVLNDTETKDAFRDEFYADEDNQDATEQEFEDAFYDYVCEYCLGEFGTVERLSDGEIIQCDANSYGFDCFFDSLDIPYDRKNVHYTIMYALEHIRKKFLDNIANPETFFDVPRLVKLVNYIEKNCA